MSEATIAKNMAAEPGSTVELQGAVVPPAAGRRAERNHPGLTAVEQPIDAPRLAVAQATLGNGQADAQTIEMAKADIEAFAAQQRLGAATKASDATDRDGQTSSGRSKKRGWRKTAIITGFLASAAIVASGCAYLFGTDKGKPTPSVFPSSTPTAGEITPPPPSKAPTITVTASPTEVPTIAPDGFTQGSDGKIVWKGTSEKGVEVDLGVPDLSKYGLKAKLETDGTVIYVDAKGARAGEFNPYVSEQQAEGSEQQTGAVDLIPSYVSKIMNDKISSIPNQADKWIIPIPLSGATKDSNVKIKYVENTFGTGMAEVNYSGKLTITNPFLKSQKAAVTPNAVYGMSLFDNYRFENAANAKTIKPGTEDRYPAVYGNFDGFPMQGATLTNSFGHKVCDNTASPIYLTYSDSTTFSLVNESKILHVAPDTSMPSAPEVPVFLNEAA